MLSNVSQSSWPAGEMVEIPGLDSEEMKILQLVLDVLSIYWQPLRELVLSTCPQTQALKLI
jgi:hypothetical protein